MAALAVRAGMSRAGALRALTLSGAEILNLQDRVGSLEAWQGCGFRRTQRRSAERLYARARNVGGRSQGLRPARIPRIACMPPAATVRRTISRRTTAALSKENRNEAVRFARERPLRLVLSRRRATATAQVAIQGDTVYTMAGAPIPQGVVIIADGKIAAVGPATRPRFPPGCRC